MSNDTGYPIAPPAPPPAPAPPPRSHKVRNIAFAVIGVVLVLVIAGAISNSTKSTTTAAAPTAATTEPTLAPAEAVAPTLTSAEAPIAATTSPMGILRPVPEQATALAAALLAIDPRMDETQRYLDRAVSQCDDVRKGEITGDALVARTKQRFEGGSMPDLTDAQAAQILDAVVTTFCH